MTPESRTTVRAANPQCPRLRWTPLQSGHVPALHALLHRIEEHDNPPYRTTLEETEERYLVDWHGQADNMLGGFDNEGELRAFGSVTIPTDAGPMARANLEGGVDPAYRHKGTGSAVLDWQIAQARALLADHEGQAQLIVHVEDDMTDSVHMLTERGFAPRRYYTELRRDLRKSIEDSALQRPLELIAWNSELDDQVRLAHNAVFTQHWVSEAHTAESWSQGRTYFMPQWSFIVLDRTSDRAQVVGYLMAGRYEQDWPSLGWTEGCIDLLGVRREWRGRGIASALVTRALRTFAADGMQYASLGVDADRPGAAFGLYSKLAFEPTRGSTMYALDL